MYGIFLTIEWLALAITLVSGILVLPTFLRFCKGLGKRTVVPVSEEYAKFAVIIPARDESSVVEANIKSVLQNEYPKTQREIYLIVESEADETVRIAQKYTGVRVFVRKEKTEAGKGFALDEFFRDLFRKKEDFDAFLILDADNLIQRDFLARMNDAFQAGYDLACGKRDNKDWNISAVSAVSGLTFTALNLLVNKPKTYHGETVVVSGTGFFVRADKLRALGGWPFHSLTEDYELTTHANREGWKTCYVETAVYYDEQPIKLKTSIIQRSRWIKGFFSVRGKYEKKKRAVNRPRRLLGAVPLLTLLITLIAYLVALFLLFTLSLCLRNGQAHLYGWRLLGLLGGAYLLVTAGTLMIFRAEKGKMGITKASMAKAALLHFPFLLTYVLAAVRAIFMQNTWEKIEHCIYKEIE